MIDKTRFFELVKIFQAQMKNFAANFALTIKNINFRERFGVLWINLKSLKPRKFRRLYKKLRKKIASSWKTLSGAIVCFLFLYYVVGACLIENVNVSNVYQLPKTNRHKSEIAASMAFLIDREIDAKMWTPNLPPVFPAYILDNMPNFQIGIITAVRDHAYVLKNFADKTPEQMKNTKKAEEFLRYSPYVWLMSKKGSFGLAPSANAQYRKARSELLKYNKTDFTVYEADFDVYLRRLARVLRLLIQKNDSHIIEHSQEFLDTKADDLFYRTRGYAFATWQIAAAAGFDYKTLLVQNNVYTEWTYLLSSLQKAAELKPLMVRNGKIDSVFGTNHLLAQNYYLERALVAVTEIQKKIQEKNADKN